MIPRHMLACSRRRYRARSTLWREGLIRARRGESRSSTVKYVEAHSNGAYGARSRVPACSGDPWRCPDPRLSRPGAAVPVRSDEAVVATFGPEPYTRAQAIIDGPKASRRRKPEFSSVPDVVPAPCDADDHPIG